MAEAFTLRNCDPDDVSDAVVAVGRSFGVSFARDAFVDVRTSRIYCLVVLVAFGVPDLLFGQTAGHRHVDTANYAILKYDHTNFFAPYPIPGTKAASLTSNEVDAMENLVEKAYHDYNMNAGPHWKLRVLATYKRQYLAYIDKHGNKMVWVNCFCRDLNADWRRHPVMVDDGGTCFFNFTINLTRKKAGKISPNGVA